MEEHEEQFLSWKFWSQKASAEIQDNKKAQSDKELEMWEGPWQSSAFQVVHEQWEPPVATAVVVSGGWEGAGIVQAQHSSDLRGLGKGWDCPGSASRGDPGCSLSAPQEGAKPTSGTCENQALGSCYL